MKTLMTMILLSLIVGLLAVQTVTAVPSARGMYDKSYSDGRAMFLSKSSGCTSCVKAKSYGIDAWQKERMFRAPCLGLRAESYGIDMREKFRGPCSIRAANSYGVDAWMKNRFDCGRN